MIKCRRPNKNVKPRRRVIHYTNLGPMAARAICGIDLSIPGRVFSLKPQYATCKNCLYLSAKESMNEGQC